MVTMEKSDLAKKIFQICYLKGHFTLRSGITSTEYFDKYTIESSPELLSAVTDHLIPLIPKDTEVLAALEMGGLPIGTALSLKTKIPVYFVRKKAKEYGTQRICEGGKIQGKKLCIVEDVITTGGQVLQSVKELRKRGAIIDSVLCLIYRGKNLGLLEEKEGLKIFKLFDKQDLKVHAQS